MAKKTKAQKKWEAQRERRQWILAVVLCAFMILGLSRQGVIGLFLDEAQRFLFGNMYWLLLCVFLVWSLIGIINSHEGNFQEQSPLPLILIAICILILCSWVDTIETGLDGFYNMINHYKDYFQGQKLPQIGGGLCGAFLYGLFSTLFGRKGTMLMCIVLLIVVTMLLGMLPAYQKMFHTAYVFFAPPKKEPKEEKPVEDPKPEPNLWTMMREHKEKKMLGTIAADEETKEETAPLSILGQEDFPREEHDSGSPLDVHSFGILADEKTEEIPLPPIPEPEEKPVEEYTRVIPEKKQEKPVEKKPEKKKGPEVPVPEIVPADDGEYHLPPVDLLDPVPKGSKDSLNEKNAREKGELLIQVLKNFDIDAQLLDTHIGPAVTQFEIRPDANVKVSRIIGLTDNIKMQMAARDIRIEAPIPGRNAVGVEIPNAEPVAVKMKELIGSLTPKEEADPLTVILGKDLLGNHVTCRLDKMPHLLIAGATGSGKSVCMNSIITSILMRTDPNEVKLLLIDPKKVEFTPYQKIPHLIGPVINDAAMANNALKIIVRIMDERYNIFANLGVRNITAYNAAVKEDPTDAQLKPMPYIVVIIDELADLMIVAGKEVEASIQRITQLARAAGIHLVVATQRPSTDVITGIIKANIPSRIAFSVSSGIDSRTILDRVGAERLLGNGDMLYMPIGVNAPTRVQGVFVTDGEVKRIADYCSAQAIPMYDDSFVMLDEMDEDNGQGGGMEINDDPLYAKVKEYVVEVQKASTSLLQRRFGIGYNRAARMIDALEQENVIGPAQGSKPRDVYMKKEDLEKKDEDV